MKFLGSDSDTPSKPSVTFEMELSGNQQNKYGKQFAGAPTPSKCNNFAFISIIILSQLILIVIIAYSLLSDGVGTEFGTLMCEPFESYLNSK